MVHGDIDGRLSTVSGKKINPGTSQFALLILPPIHYYIAPTSWPPAQIGITRSPLPQNQGKLPLSLFGGNFWGNFAWFYWTKLP